MLVLEKKDWKARQKGNDSLHRAGVYEIQMCSKTRMMIPTMHLEYNIGVLCNTNNLQYTSKSDPAATACIAICEDGYVI
eukprot:3873578-Amphidinium_carterae.1